VDPVTGSTTISRKPSWPTCARSSPRFTASRPERLAPRQQGNPAAASYRPSPLLASSLAPLGGAFVDGASSVPGSGGCDGLSSCAMAEATVRTTGDGDREAAIRAPMLAACLISASCSRTKRLVCSVAALTVSAYLRSCWFGPCDPGSAACFGFRIDLASRPAERPMRPPMPGSCCSSTMSPV
jgi:hypothetical protein